MTKGMGVWEDGVEISSSIIRHIFMISPHITVLCACDSVCLEA